MSTVTQMFINSPIIINQDTNVYSSFLNEGMYDYTFCINIASISNDITGIFANASFIQNSTNIDNYDVNLTINPSTLFNNWENKFNNENLVTVNVGNSNIAFATLLPNTYQTIGDRLLEVVAHKLFGHGQAHAAISNDHEFYLHDAQIWDHLSNTVAMNQYRNDIFNQYIATGRYSFNTENCVNNCFNNENCVNNCFNNENCINNCFNNENCINNCFNNNEYSDTQRWVNFNFDGLTFDFPLFLVGNMLHDPSLTMAEIEIIQNGPKVGGTSLINGHYNIPILIRFHQ